VIPITKLDKKIPYENVPLVILAIADTLTQH